MADLRGRIDTIGDGRQVYVVLCDAHYHGCVGFGPVFRMPPDVNAESVEFLRPQQEIMDGLGWKTYLDGGSNVCPNCVERFQNKR